MRVCLRGTRAALRASTGSHLSTRLLDRLNEETRSLQPEADRDLQMLLGPVALSETPGLERFLEPRRLGKHKLIEHDLMALGLKVREVESIPQCMSIPLFETVHDALGWAYLTERSTLMHTQVFHHLASVMPGEVAFAASFLKCYVGSAAEMWRSFGQSMTSACSEPGDLERVLAAARASFVHHRNWHTYDGGAIASAR